MVTIAGGFGKKEALAQYTYVEASKALRKMGWQVVSYKETLKSPSLKKYYNKKIKKGYFPLTRGRRRIEVNGIPQHYYIQGLRKSPVLDSITRELGVDALVFLYMNTNRKCMSVAGNCVNAPKYSSSVTLNAYDALRDKSLINMSFNGPKIKKQKNAYKKLNVTKTSMLTASSRALEGLGEKLGTKLK